MATSSIGDRELMLLHYLDECGSASVGEVAANFGAQHGLARSTVLTMMERLRGKGYIKRRQTKGTYRYSPITPPSEAMRHAIDRFVEGTLRGSVSPFVAWMAGHGEISEEEFAELNALVKRLRNDRKGK